ncbi:SAM-dependent methyltransferase [Thermostichus vulcanus]|uniref:Methyltransferase domain-containing protein n=1 Tax=Thermostichus vulcanus str. 'Rupite' TaxID=2813851 RepID=A0ABT0CBQ7_THEVL|nr:methyltransferase domain-containing protein [Thermostichus vulcanus]MCJ2543147.1 methyltransferase domain-containing protein [Thermostichus vulcanus str. 'Rupite']
MTPRGFKPKVGQNSNRRDPFPDPNSSTISLAPYVRTLPVVIDAMLDLAQVGSEDTLYDLGCGDGRVLIRAAQRFGTRGVGVDIDPERILEAEQQAQAAGVQDRVNFLQQDLLTLDLAPATVVSCYLLPRSNLLIRDKLRSELQAGARLVTHSFDMGDWIPTATTTVSDVINTYTIYLWQIESQLSPGDPNP